MAPTVSSIGTVASRQAVRQKVLHGHRAGIDAQPISARIAQRAELHRKQRLFPAPFERAPDERFVMPHPIEVAGIEQVDAAFERGMNGRDALVLIGLSVNPGHPHASESYGKDLGKVAPQPTSRALVA